MAHLVQKTTFFFRDQPGLSKDMVCSVASTIRGNNTIYGNNTAYLQIKTNQPKSATQGLQRLMSTNVQGLGIMCQPHLAKKASQESKAVPVGYIQHDTWDCKK